MDQLRNKREFDAAMQADWDKAVAEFTTRGFSLDGDIGRWYKAGFEAGFNGGAYHGMRLAGQKRIPILSAKA